jgi:hypothetical protein
MLTQIMHNAATVIASYTGSTVGLPLPHGVENRCQKAIFIVPLERRRFSSSGSEIRQDQPPRSSSSDAANGTRKFGMSTPFVSELARRLQGQGPALALPLTWIEQQLAESGLSIEKLVHSGNRQQAADQVSISNSIGSLRLLGTTDWRTFVEAMSLVEQTLRTDPADAYATMDFASRDRYRHVIEEVARASRLPEDMVASHAIELARTSADDATSDGRAGHVGHYLIDRGKAELELATGTRRSFGSRLSHLAREYPLAMYLGSITLLTLFSAGGLLTAARVDAMVAWALLPLGVLVLLAASQLALALVNWLATFFVSPHPLARMDFSAGIPAASRALVVIPTMLTSRHGLDSLVDSLEVRFLANRDANLHFGLLTDFADAAEETLAEDAALLASDVPAALKRLQAAVATNGRLVEPQGCVQVDNDEFCMTFADVACGRLGLMRLRGLMVHVRVS